RVARAQLHRGEVRVRLLGERNAPERGLGLRRAVLAQARVLPPYVQYALVQVDVLPRQPDQLAQPQPGEYRRLEQRRVVVASLRLPCQVLGRVDQRRDLVVVPDVILLTLAALRSVVVREE